MLKKLTWDNEREERRVRLEPVLKDSWGTLSALVYIALATCGIYVWAHVVVYGLMYVFAQHIKM